MKTIGRPTERYGYGAMCVTLALLAALSATAEPVAVVAGDAEIMALKEGGVTAATRYSRTTTTTVAPVVADLPELIAAALTTAGGQLAQGEANAADEPQTERISTSRETTLTRGSVTLSKRSKSGRNGTTETCELRCGRGATWRTVNGVWQGGAVSPRDLRAAVTALRRAGFEVTDVVVTVGDAAAVARAGACLEKAELAGDVQVHAAAGQTPAAQAAIQEAR